MWTDDPWARVQLQDENFRAQRALAEEWAEITNLLSALCADLDTGVWASDAQKRAYEQAREIQHSARMLSTQLWDAAA